MNSHIKNKLYVFSLMIVAIFLVSFGGCDNHRPPNYKKTIKIGVLLPLTGGAASYGKNSLRGIKLAKEQFVSSNHAFNIDLKVQDSKGEAATGVQAAQKLVEFDHVQAVIGGVTSGVTLAVAPIMNARHIPLIATGASSPNISQAGEYIFRTWPSDTLEAAVMARYISSQRIKKLAILRINNEYGLAMSANFKGQLPANVQLVDEETFAQGAHIMRTQLLHIKESGAEALYFIGFPEAAIVFGNSLPASGLAIKIFATSAFEDPQIPLKTGRVLDNTIYTKPVSDSPRAKLFQKAYIKKFNVAPGITSATAYDAAMLVFNAIKTIKENSAILTGAAIIQQLHLVKNFQGASGVLTFKKNGDVVKPVGLYILKNGTYQKLGQ